MNRFSDASPAKGGIPKTFTTMKKYSTPNTESVNVMSARMMQSYTPSDSLGSGARDPLPNPNPSTPTF